MQIDKVFFLKKSVMGTAQTLCPPILTVLLLVLAFLFSTSEVSAQVPTCTSEAPAESTIPSTAATQRVYAFGVQNVTYVLFPTWWPGNGNQNDIQWLPGVNAGNGTWYVDIPLNQYDVGSPRFGTFNTHVYMSNTTNINVFCGGGAWTRNSPSQLQTSASEYFYDANSRLVDIFNGSSNGGWQYDFLGNISSISTGNSNDPPFSEFFPISGSPGTLVQIHGHNFSSTPSSDVVTFNGTQATVNYASSTDLMVTVPSGATTGLIQVNTGGMINSASSIPFTVLPGTFSDVQGAQPNILGFTPGSGGPGSSITVSGTSFNPFPGQTVVRLGGTVVVPTSISDTSIAFNIPPDQGTANIYVTTPYGTAVSSAALSVPMTSVPLGSVISSTATLTANGAAQPLNLSGTHACGAYTFSAQANQWVSLQISSLTTSPSGGTLNYMLYGPTNQAIGNSNNQTYNANPPPSICGLGAPQTLQQLVGTISSANMSIHLPPMPATGAYTLILDSGASTSTQLTTALITDPTVGQGGSVAATFSVAGQSQRVQFVGAQGQLIVVDSTTSSTTPTNGSLVSTWLDQQGNILSIPAASAAVAGASSTLVNGADSYVPGGVIISGSLPTTTGSAQVLLDTSSVGTTTVDSTTTLTVNQTANGKASRITMPLTAGQQVTIAASAVVTSQASFSLRLFDSFGNSFASTVCYVPTKDYCSMDLAGAFRTLPVPTMTGNYTLVLQPATSAYSYKTNITSSSDLTATLSAGVTTSVSLTRPSQTKRLTYTSVGAHPTLISVFNIAASLPTSNPGIWGWMYNPSTPTDQIEENGASAANAYGLVYWEYLTGGQQRVFQITADNQDGTVLQGNGSGATGSAKLYVDTTTTSVAISTTPTSAVIPTTANAGQAVQFRYNNATNQLIHLQMSNISTPSGTGTIQAIVLYAMDTGGGSWDYNYTTVGSCAVGSICNFSISPSPYGGTPQELIILPFGAANNGLGGDHKPPPYTANTKFGATLTFNY